MSLAAVVMSAVAVWVPAPEVKHRHRHKHRPPPPMRSALASWYALHGGGACGVHDVQDGYRFASLILRCGARIRICHRRCVTATMADRGPYINGRTFDLNYALKTALGCPDLCWVKWRLA
jgi:hypothetical protein